MAASHPDHPVPSVDTASAARPAGRPDDPQSGLTVRKQSEQ